MSIENLSLEGDLEHLAWLDRRAGRGSRRKHEWSMNALFEDHWSLNRVINPLDYENAPQGSFNQSITSDEEYKTIITII